ncbi:MAG TPA: DNA polymerase III subunit delta [Clostridiales bacterium]|jgi:DNA polymerase-3 subunit delta|nr:DNA polymerase III subunit delta [Clostridiales bacterium]HPP67826.1 DNA polymerase III subunit delta [Clostridiales bacterium]HQA05032.1 DNA polymerase III subunit delta [Clostridiales bacterium]
MPLFDETRLKNYLKEPSNVNVFLIYGEDDYLKDYYSAFIRDRAVDPAFSAFNLHGFEADEMDISSVWDCATAYPLMSERSCVFIKGMKLAALKKDAVEDIKRLISEIPDFCTLIVKAEEGAEEEKRNAAVKDMVGAFSKAGIAACLSKRQTNSIVTLIMNGAKSRGSSITKEAAAYLVEIVGDDLLVLMNELTKLAAFAGKDGITKEIIDKVAVKSVEASIFDLSAAIIEKNSDKAYRILSALKLDKVSPQMIIGTLSSYFADLYRAKVADKERAGLSNIISAYDYKNTAFRLEKAMKAAGKIGMKSIRKALENLTEADSKIKSTGADSFIVIESLVASLLTIN